MCCLPGLTAVPNSLRPWIKSILQEPLEPVGLISPSLCLSAVSSVCIIVCLDVHFSSVCHDILLHALSLESLSACAPLVLSFHFAHSPFQSDFDPIIFLSVCPSIYMSFCPLFLLYICRLYLICNQEDAICRFNDTQSEKWFHIPCHPLLVSSCGLKSIQILGAITGCWISWLYCSLKLSLESCLTFIWGRLVCVSVCECMIQHSAV